MSCFLAYRIYSTSLHLITTLLLLCRSYMYMYVTQQKREGIQVYAGFLISWQHSSDDTKAQVFIWGGSVWKYSRYVNFAQAEIPKRHACCTAIYICMLHCVTHVSVYCALCDMCTNKHIYTSTLGKLSIVLCSRVVLCFWTKEVSHRKIVNGTRVDNFSTNKFLYSKNHTKIFPWQKRQITIELDEVRLLHYVVATTRKQCLSM